MKSLFGIGQLALHFTPAKVWMGLFGCWGILLSGVGSTITGSPGALQALRLQNLLQDKMTQLSQLEEEVKVLEGEVSLLEKSRVAQEREIRRVLGYAAKDEIIFDFATSAERFEPPVP